MPSPLGTSCRNSTVAPPFADRSWAFHHCHPPVEHRLAWGLRALVALGALMELWSGSSRLVDRLVVVAVVAVEAAMEAANVVVKVDSVFVAVGRPFD